MQIGGGAPVVVQSMTKTDTTDVEGTVGQIEEMVRAGLRDRARRRAERGRRRRAQEIRQRVPDVPLVADIHFHYKLALMALEAGIDKLRINPGNIGAHRARPRGRARDAGARQSRSASASTAARSKKTCSRSTARPRPRRWSNRRCATYASSKTSTFADIIISLKASDVHRTVAAYRLLAEQVDYPLHLGVTEAGTPFGGTIKSAIGLGILLHEGIGDTIRVSLAAEPHEEVRVAWEILKSLELRKRGVTVVACPTCGRLDVDNFVEIVTEIERRLAHVEEPLHLSIMGCAVNGPGEAHDSQLGITFGRNVGMIFKDGVPMRKVAGADIVEAFVAEAEKLVKEGSAAGSEIFPELVQIK